MNEDLYLRNSKRLEVITNSIFVERIASNCLALLLEVDLVDSKTLGNKSTSFSFKQKIDLLTDIKALKKEEIEKFTIFTEIRNQFAHNFDVIDFTTCFSFLDGKEKRLRKLYPKWPVDSSSKESELQGYYNRLHSDIVLLANSLLQKVTQKYTSQGFDLGLLSTYKRIVEIMKVNANSIRPFNEVYYEILAELKKEEPST